MGEKNYARYYHFVKNRPTPVTPDQMLEQSIDFAYGNLAASTNHRLMREAFRQLALEKGWTEERFNQWADGKEWRDAQP
jgi:hypothetical protein